MTRSFRAFSKAALATAIALGVLLGSLPALAGPTVYTMTNDPLDNGNAVLAFRIADGSALVPLGRYPTGGKGWRTEMELPHFGPFDNDQPIIVDRDNKRLFAVNGGSDSIAVFDIRNDGSLAPVPGSPFPSGGVNPASVGLADDFLIVVNKNADPGRDMSGTLPNYASFRVGDNGALTPVPNGTVELETASRSPTQALIAENRFVFDGDFGSFWVPQREAMWGPELRDQRPSLIRSLSIDENGVLNLVHELEPPAAEFEGGIDTDQDGVADPLMFGLQVHPTEPLVYISYVTSAKLAIYEYDENGKMTFVDAVPNSGQLICWIAINAEGTRAYTTNGASDSVSVYDLSDPRAPKEVQHLELRGYGAPYQVGLSADEKNLMISKHRTFPKTPIGDGSVLNLLEIRPDGTLEEVAHSPYTIPSRGDLLARPMGIASF